MKKAQVRAAVAGKLIELRDPNAVLPSPAAAVYAFEAAFDDDHFVSEYIAYTSGRTDAAHEYHEAAGLIILAAATPNVRAHLAPYPGGLPTNLYALAIGDSTTSRKSTTQDLAKDLLLHALPGSVSSDHFSPEGFAEQLAARPRESTTLFVDEFSELLDKLHHSKHMAGLRGLLLTLYSGNDYRYRRVSKRSRDGAKLADEDCIEAPHLSVLGATTPAIFRTLTESDVISGLLPRFAIVMPTSKPARRPFFEVTAGIDQRRAALIGWLQRLHAWAMASRQVRFAPEALARLDGSFEALETAASQEPSETVKAMVQRLTPMAIKVAMLAAAGQPGAHLHDNLIVTTEDAETAIRLIDRWRGYAVEFAERIGENDFELKLQRCLRLAQKKRRVPRSLVARQAHVDRRTLDAIRDTLLDREAISVDLEKAPSGPPKEVWVIRQREELL